MKQTLYKLCAAAMVVALLISGLSVANAQGGSTIVGRGGIRHMAASADGKYLAVASTIGIWLYDATDVTAAPRFVGGHSEEVMQVAFSPDSTKLASVSLDRTVGLWDVESGERLETFEGVRSGFYSVAYSPDGKTIAAGTVDQNTIRLWDVETGRAGGILQGHRNFPNTLSFSADGKQLASGSSEQSVRIWDVESGSELRLLDEIKARVNIVAYSPDGSLLAVGGSGGNVLVYETGDYTVVQTLEMERANIGSLSFSPDGETLAVGAALKIFLWEVSTGKNLTSFDAHRGSVISLVFSADGSQIISGAFDNAIRVFNANNTREVAQTRAEHARELLYTTFSADGRFSAYATSGDPFIRLVTLADGSTQLIDNTNTTSALTFSRDASLLAASSSGSVILYDTATLRAGNTLRASNQTGGIASLAFNSDSSLLAVGYSQGVIVIYNVANGRTVNELIGHTQSVRSLSFSADDKTLYSTSSDGSLRIWSLE
ncbi:MAG: WD40 repeat domain-containing protein [Chloroflexi bacterium CFX4]|nr:WD40 repeat domain-containing protein [Chloroflexi bacterium CFX4]MDL1921350.1 WD40 repeat domain-containing protein [Chloroflexi bacterium CFX3]